ncbi:uncharacterized protein LOC108704357 [Xenopus laevis]|uniref:Uncharacterized protein LOC108704357 n=1 Tax=Xenopus laevis TaxID=8355 RepID=A0A8J1MKA5_XENLA|nr:uncharacterized protein LOC108704357 [Xenopus laevis]XP_041441824.1 uncharacterized protein LOC108704357 [Xenopus laevis]XP_041441825.1 uncharacterized protein LOC108704357 [Xenopus laevis]XP_041441826.1 uncharacterized protein LOC108704357 [Xenopus laevis]OCT58139.1 hypothetical protein XELAEV_18002468mg [Xenopus laevis]
MLRRILPDGRRDSQWEAVCHVWEKLTVSQYFSYRDQSQVALDKNLLSEWCVEWEKFQYLVEDLPGSKRRKAKVFKGFHVIAKKTLKSLEDSETMNNKLTQANKVLEERLQSEEKARSAINKELMDSQDEQIRLAKSIDVLNEELKIMQLKEQDSQAKQMRLIQSMTNLAEELRTKEEVVQDSHTTQMSFVQSTRNLVEELKIKVKELQNFTKQVEPFKGAVENCKTGNAEVLEMGKRFLNELVRQRNDNANRYPSSLKAGGNPNKALQFPEGPLHSWYEMDTIATKMGLLTSNNIFDWLYKCEEQMNVENWTMKEVERLLHRCMEPNKFSALDNMIDIDNAPWLKVCLQVVRCLRPQISIHEMFAKDKMRDKMREQESALEFFNRLWMKYRILKQSDNVSRNDVEYKLMILEGLLPKLKQVNPDQVHLDYSVLLNKVLAAEDAWRTSQELLYLKKPPLGFPSRNEIWRRLKRHENPRQTVNWFPYWNLLVRLSHYEDLSKINVLDF